MPNQRSSRPPGGLAFAVLRERCRAIQADQSHEPYCFELFWQAIVEKNEQCWSAVHDQYKALVYQWVQAPVKTSRSPLEVPIEDVAQSAFEAFLRAFTPDKMRNADGLSSVLAYLKSCAVTAALQLLRKQRREARQVDWEPETLDRTFAVAPPEQVDPAFAERLWAVVDQCCADDRERLLARLSFVSDLKPRAILARHPGLFTDEAEIYGLRRNLKNRLLRNPVLQELWRDRDDP